MLSKHREKWEKFKQQDDRQARSELIAEFVPLVHYVYGRMTVYLPRVLDESDLIAAGTIGLISAVDEFDPERGLEFSTFAVPRIRGAILDELRQHDWVPRTARRRAAELSEAIDKARESETDAPDYRKVARSLGIDQKDLVRHMSRLQPVAFVTLDHASDDRDDDSLSVSQLVANDHSADPAYEVELADQFVALGSALEQLPGVERGLIQDYYFGERMQKEIAEDLAVSRSRVSQLHNRAIQGLRERMGAA
jgi:RNA polymerase sigma factor for flagellar operon FliA